MEQTLSLAAAVHRFDAPLPVVAGRKQQKASGLATKKAWKSAPRLGEPEGLSTSSSEEEVTRGPRPPTRARGRGGAAERVSGSPQPRGDTPAAGSCALAAGAAPWLDDVGDISCWGARIPGLGVTLGASNPASRGTPAPSRPGIDPSPRPSPGPARPLTAAVAGEGGAQSGTARGRPRGRQGTPAHTNA